MIEGMCDACNCTDPDHTDLPYCCKLESMVNGICDLANNNAACHYDGLDCCSSISRLTVETEYFCPLEEHNCNMQKLIDQNCDSNTPLDTEHCLYDMGQCCDDSITYPVDSICNHNKDGILQFNLFVIFKCP